MVYLHGNRQSGYTKHKEYAMLSLPLVRDKGGHVSVQRCGRTTHHGRWLETHQRCAPAKSAPSHWTRATARHNSRWSALGGGERCEGAGDGREVMDRMHTCIHHVVELDKTFESG